MRRAVALLLVLLALTPPLVAAAQPNNETGDAGRRTLALREPVTVRAAAVANTPQGLVGSTATVQLTVAPGGSGHVFMDTLPLAEVDMQGSARLAVRVAATLAGVDWEQYDYFFVVRSGSPIIGGPSAGGIMSVATVAALNGWTVDDRVMMTGTINPDGTVGPVGGIPEKAEAAQASGAQLFLFPRGQERSLTGDGQSVHVPTYCDRRLGITCRAVADVEEAVRAVTGHAFEAPPPPGNVTTKDYEALMRPLATELLNRANATVTEARAGFDNRSGVPGAVVTDMRERLRLAEAGLAEAEAAERAGKHYTTASRAFLATVRARHVASVMDFYKAEDADAFLEKRLEAVAGDVAAARKASKAAEARGLAQLEAVGAAQSRAMEADATLSRAREIYGNRQSGNDYVLALDHLAYATERAATVHWWLDIGESFAQGAVVNATQMADSAREAQEASRQSVAYASLLLQKMGAGGSPLVAQAEEKLASAERASEEGFMAAAIFDALEAETRASLALETAGLRSEEAVESRVERARQRAARAIAESRELGVEPILAVSYYEYAGELENPVDQLSFYGFSKTIAKATRFMLDADPEPRASRFVGADPAVTGPVLRLQDAGAVFALGVALGVGLALAAVVWQVSPAARRRPGRPDEP